MVVVWSLMKPIRRQWTLGLAMTGWRWASFSPEHLLGTSGNMFEQFRTKLVYMYFSFLFVMTSCSKAKEVVCVLKALSEDGELSLSDGRTIVRPDSPAKHGNMVRMSPDFRLIVLANRPGYPFMGVFSLIQFPCLYFGLVYFLFRSFFPRSDSIVYDIMSFNSWHIFISYNNHDITIYNDI